MHRLQLCATLGVGLFYFGPTSAADENQAEQSAQIKAVKDVLRAQATAWNEGNVELYVQHYWKSEKLTFSSGGTTTRGWANTLARYKKRYPTRADMGKLTFTNLELTFLGNEAALVLGRWHLQRKPKDLRGNFSLVLRKIKDRWVIIHDHTSLASP